MISKVGLQTHLRANMQIGLYSRICFEYGQCRIYKRKTVQWLWRFAICRKANVKQFTAIMKNTAQASHHNRVIIYVRFFAQQKQTQEEEEEKRTEFHNTLWNLSRDLHNTQIKTTETYKPERESRIFSNSVKKNCMSTTEYDNIRVLVRTPENICFLSMALAHTHTRARTYTLNTLREQFQACLLLTYLCFLLWIDQQK